MDIIVINEMFVNICENIDWDFNGLMLWGYFFVNIILELFNGLVEKLVVMGYSLVEIFELELEEGEVLYYVLYVECVEVYIEVLLDVCNYELQILVEQNGVEDYDGMDVGLVEI